MATEHIAMVCGRIERKRIAYRQTAAEMNEEYGVRLTPYGSHLCTTIFELSQSLSASTNANTAYLTIGNWLFDRMHDICTHFLVASSFSLPFCQYLSNLMQHRPISNFDFFSSLFRSFVHFPFICEAEASRA